MTLSGANTQIARVLAAAERPDGLCQAEYLDPGRHGLPGARITRVAARIQDLERAGYAFEHVGWRLGTKVYRLVAGTGTVGRGAPELPSPPEGLVSATAAPVPPGRLFDPPALPHYSSEAA